MHNFKPEDCSQYQRCSAPLCPLDTNLDEATWFPDEPVCSCHKLPNGDSKPEWVKKQRKIKSRCTVNGGVYTLAMIKVIKWVTRKLHGVNPEGDVNKLSESFVRNRKRAAELAAKNPRVWPKKSV